MAKVITNEQAKVINSVLMIIAPLPGLLLHKNPLIYFLTFAQVLFFIFGSVTSMCLLVQMLGKSFGKKLQELPSPCLREFGISLKSMYIAALLMSWPVSAFKMGEIHNFVWDIHASTAKDSLLGNILLIGGVMLFDDVYQYMLHRLLHVPFLFAFHQTHHNFFNPSAYSVLALSPVEAFLHFMPVLFNMIPTSNGVVLWIPLFLTYYLTRFLQGVYMHSGYCFDIVEKILPRVCLATSEHHNFHHSKSNINFAEFFTILDIVFNDGMTPYNKISFEKKYYKLQCSWNKELQEKTN